MTAGPLMERALEVLDDLGVGWVVLRGDPDDPARDIDLLVDDTGLRRVRGAWRGLGFAERSPDAATAPATFVAYDPVTDRWAVVDALDAVVLGPSRVAAAAITGRAVREGRVSRPDPDDAWWLALLHEAVDRGSPREERLAALAATRPDGALGGPENPALRAALQGVHGLEAAARDLAGALGTGRRAHRLAAARVRHSVGGGAGRAFAIRARQALGRRIVRRQHALTIALMGPDGVGKSTLASSLSGPRARPLVPVYLGLYGRGPGAVGAGRVPGLGLVRRLLVLARAHVRVARLRAAGHWVVFDRHPLDGLVAAPGGSRLARVRRRLLAAAAPRPDLIVVLDAPVEVLLGRKQEHGAERIAAMLDGYRALAASDRRALLVDADRPVDAVRRDVQAVLAAQLRTTGHANGSAPRPVVRGERRAPAPRVAGGSGRSRARATRIAARLRAMLELRRARPVAVGILRATPGLTAAGASGDGAPSRSASPGVPAPAPGLGAGHVALSGACMFPIVAGGRTILYLRLARRPVAARSLRRATTVLHALERLPDGPWRPLVPTVRAAGRSGEWRFLAEGAMPGRPARLRPADDETWLIPAADAIGMLHAATARPAVVDAAVVARIVDRPARRIAACLRGAGSPPRVLEAADHLRAWLPGRELRLGWVHGDYWGGNVLLDAHGVTGIVDWDSARCHASPATDLVHLLAHARRRRTGRTYGTSLRELFEGTDLTSIEEAVLSRLWTPGPTPGDLRRAEFALAWLNLVDTALRRYPRIAANRAWVSDILAGAAPWICMPCTVPS